MKRQETPGVSAMCDFLTCMRVGRAWKASELRLKSFEDLQKLWYVCYKEQNLLLSEKARQTLEGKLMPNWSRMKAVRGFQ